MTNSRLALHKIFVGILGNNNVYFQPPTNTQLKYPCIVYSLAGISEKTANDKKYIRYYKYRVTLILSSPDNCIVDRIMDLPYSSFDNYFSTQGLNHYIFTIYYKNEKEII